MKAVKAALAALTFALALAAGAGAQELAPAAAPPDATRVLGPPRGAPVSGAALEAATARVSALLRCPVCQGLSVADSPTPLALDMRRQVRELLAHGYDEEQVLSYFERSYGEFVRLEPPRRGINWLVWLAPAGGLAVGAAVVAFALRRLRGPLGATRPPVSTDPEPPAADPALAPYLLRVRELAYGWPGGREPQPPA